MPIIKSAKKAARQATVRTARNEQIKKDIKAALKALKIKPSRENLSKVQSEYDKAVKKDLMKKNTASRRKAVAAKIAKAGGVKIEGEKKAAKPAAKAAPKAAAKAPAKKAATPKKAAAKKPAAKKAA